MVITKITFTSVELDFPDFQEFESYCDYLIGREKFIEIAYLFRDPILNGTMLPYEKSHWIENDKVGYLQQYHESSLHSKEFQLSLMKSPHFSDLLQLLREVQITVSIEMLPSDEFDLVGNVAPVDFSSPEVLVRSGK